MKHLILSMIFLSHTVLFSQGLFDSALSEESGNSSLPYEMNGFTRGTYFIGKVQDKDQSETKAGYGELGLKLKVRKDFGDGFAEIRFRRGQEFGKSISEIDIREAYVNLYWGNLDVRVGQQIVVWGRADGFNPTNNITPQNMLIRSPDEDDRRQSNFLIRTWYNLSPFRLEAIFIPQYASSVIPTNVLTFEQGIQLNEIQLPNAKLKNSSYAVRLSLEKAAFDGSLSFYQGWIPLPGIQLVDFVINASGPVINLAPVPYKMQVIGGDFSTTLGKFGLRAEVAYRNPVKDWEDEVSIPNSDIYGVIGGDRSWGDFTFLIQYVGRYVMDFEKADPSDPLIDLIDKNRMLSSQQDEITHSISFRPALSLMHETLNLEVLGLVNFTTEEMLLRPKMSYDVSDDLSLILGAEIYNGPDETLFGFVQDVLSGIFIEIRTSF